MKTIKYILASFVLVASLASCVKSLDVTPIDPNKNTADKAFTKAEDYNAFLAGIYTGYATSGYKGPNSDPSISGLDGGMSQYIRGMFHLTELSEQDIADACGRVPEELKKALQHAYRNISEFHRAQIPGSVQVVTEPGVTCEMHYHAIDNFGNVPFADEKSVVGQIPIRITRTELYNWLETELIDIIENSELAERAQTEYGRINKTAVKMILAKLYLNAKVYTGTAEWDQCAAVLKDIMDDGYSLHTTSAGGIYSPYQELFLADNDKRTDEIIFAIEQDGIDTQSYGVTNYLIFAFTGGTMKPDDLGISSGWSGCRMTPEFYHKFTANDDRAIFWTDGQTEDVADMGEFTNGIGFQKYKNITADGIPGKAAGFVDTDFPVFRYADVLLMAAECAMNGSTVISATDGLGYLNEVRARAGLAPETSLDVDKLLDERARELYLELWRRQDLVRYDYYTTDKYIWQWKGGVHDGKAVESYKNLFPIPNSDMMVNPNLEQNDGYNK